jgi:hypothetical protein
LADAELADEEVDRLGRIAGPPALVVVDGAVEAACGELVDTLAQNFKYTRAPRSSKASW